MMRCPLCWKPVLCFGLFFLLNSSPAWGQDFVKVKEGVLQWGGPGYDITRIKGSTRFTAKIGKQDSETDRMLVEIVVDSSETWEDLGKLSLMSADGTVTVTSIGRYKSMRHVTASWACVFFEDDIKQLPDHGLIVAWNSTSKQILSEKTDFRPIKAMVADVQRNQEKPLSKNAHAGDGKQSRLIIPLASE